MKLKEKLKEKVNSDYQEREIGRYNASELYSILIGEITPQNFLKRKEKDKEASWHISWGNWAEKGLSEDVFEGWEKQVKKEIQCVDFVISCKADFVNQDKVLEVKCPRRLPYEIRKNHFPQLEAYYRAFKKPVEIMYINRDNYKVFKYKPSDKYWEMIIEKISEFHKKLTPAK